MFTRKFFLFLSIALVLLVLTAAAARQATKEPAKGETKAAPAKAKPAAAGPILHPEMTPTGTYAKPMGKIGEKPAEPWSATTIEAAVDGKPNRARVETVTGEIVDFSCYLQLGKHGDKHRDCGQKCLRSGMPIGLLAKDGSLYLLMEEEHHPRRDGQTNFRDSAIDHMAHVMEVTGTASQVHNYKALYVTGFKK